MDSLDPDDGFAWPSSKDSLLTPPDDYWTLADLAWQRKDLTGRLMGYRRAADVLYESMTESTSTGDRDTVTYPYGMIWRHWLELQLKSLLIDLRAMTGTPTPKKAHHRIDTLWAEVRGLMAQVLGSEDDAAADVHRVIAELATIDPDGQGFRYDADTRGTPTLTVAGQLNLREFHKAMSGIANYLAGSVDMLDAHRQTAAEMAEYYDDAPNWSDYG